MAITPFFVSTVEIKSPIPVLAQQKSKPIKNCGKSQENFSKTNGTGWGLHFSAVLSSAQSATNFKVSCLFWQGQGERCENEANRSSAKSIKKRKNIENAIEMLVSFKFQDEKHGNDCKNFRIKTHQKLWQKPWKLQQNKWKKAGDCISRQCSAVLTLQLMPTFLEFLQG